MKYLTLFISATVLLSCNNQPGGNGSMQSQMQSQIDSLQQQLTQTYKPGFGEFMGSIQIHHAKLWFAGKNQNWVLADFEMNEMQESLTDIKAYCKNRPETGLLGMIAPPMDSIAKSIRQKSFPQFRRSYVLLTNTCNNCHQVTRHGFNVIKIPGKPPFDNQDFQLKQ